MASCKLGFVVNQHVQKSNLSNSFWWKHPVLNFNKIHKTAYGLHGHHGLICLKIKIASHLWYKSVMKFLLNMWNCW